MIRPLMGHGKKAKRRLTSTSNSNSYRKISKKQRKSLLTRFNNAVINMIFVVLTMIIMSFAASFVATVAFDFSIQILMSRVNSNIQPATLPFILSCVTAVVLAVLLQTGKVFRFLKNSTMNLIDSVNRKG